MKHLRWLVILLSIFCIACGDDPVSPPRAKLNPVTWVTSSVSLEADHFFMVCDGDTFFADVEAVQIQSDDGDSNYCSLELEWLEKGKNQRLYIYFHADTANWWSDQFRTYDGKDPAEWLYYYGSFFMTPLGKTFSADVEFNSDTSDFYQGKVFFKGLKLRAFLNL